MTKSKSVLAALALTGALLLVPQISAADSLSVEIVGGDGGSIGSLTVSEATHGALLNVQISAGGLTPGVHGMHLHAVANCSDVGKFKLSTGHINSSDSAHGLLNSKGPDNADLPNLIVHADGSANVEIFTAGVSLKAGDVPLLDGDGSALVIHANPDDHMTQPIGGAGPRVACAEIKG